MREFFDESKVDSRFIKEKTVQATVFSLTASVIGIIISLSGNIFLARLLSPAIFGAFGIITFAVHQIPTLLLDMGLPDALIQKKEPLKQRELALVFTVNAFTAALFVILIFLLAPFLAGYYGIDSQGSWLFRFFSLIIFASLIETIPITLLRRRIAFGQLALVSLIGILFFNLTAAILAFLNFGLLSLILGTLLSRFVSLAFLLKLQSWRFAFNLKTDELAKLFSFSLPFKGTTLVGLLSLSIVPLLVGSISGLGAVGYFSFADRVTNLFLFVPSTIGLILFTSLSRSQSQQPLFKDIIEKSVEWISFIIFPAVAIFIALAPQIVSFFFTDKWLPGIWILYLGVASVAFSALGSIFSQSLFSLGESKVMLKIVFWTVLVQWLLSIVLIAFMGYNGVAVARFIAAPAAFVPFFVLNRRIKLSIAGKVLPYLIVSCLVGLFIKLATPYYLRAFIDLFLAIGFGVFGYLLLLFPFKGRVLWMEGLKIKNLLAYSFTHRRK